MRILHLAPCYFPSDGGAQRHLREISTYLAKLGHTVTVATTDADDVAALWDPNKRRVAEPVGFDRGVTIRRFRLAHLPGSPLSYRAAHRGLWALQKSGVPQRVLERYGRNHPRVPSLHRWLQTTEESYDLVAAMNLPYDSILIAARDFAQRRNIPFVAYPLAHFGSGDRPGGDEESQFYTMRHQNRLIAESDCLIAQTKFEADFYHQQGLPQGHSTVIGPGVHLEDVQGGNAERFRLQNEIKGPIVLGIGRLTQPKGTVQTVEAVRNLWREGVQVELVLIGAEYDDFRAYWAGLDAASQRRIHKVGYVSDQTRRDALAAANVLAMPSRIDSFGMVYLEAWACGVPVIGADVFAARELIDDGVAGRLVPFGDAGVMASVIGEMVGDSAETARMGASGLAKVISEHSWAAKCEQILTTYRALVPEEL